uniref:Uncharacterized protein n=1 Tax=Quercus lobata TaxID=97700 RepID=A0A7N2R4B1_QUELO
MTGQLAWTVQEELETLLDDSGHLRMLAFLYASKGISSKALAIWRVLARNYSTGLWKDPTLENDIQDTSNNGISSKEIVAIEASKILEESSDQDLVLQHLGWVANINQVLAVQVLTSEKRANQLSPGGPYAYKNGHVMMNFSSDVIYLLYTHTHMNVVHAILFCVL